MAANSFTFDTLTLLLGYPVLWPHIVPNMTSLNVSRQTQTHMLSSLEWQIRSSGCLICQLCGLLSLFSSDPILEVFVPVKPEPTSGDPLSPSPYFCDGGSIQ